jgi:DNA-binding transcriptional ArsR family regulator
MASDEHDSPSTQESLTAEDAFALIGNETRAEILRVLGQDAHSAFSFSELRSRLNPDIDSSQFNYHLRQFVGHFVEQTNDGYQVRPRGRTLYRMIRAGTFTRHKSFDHLDIEIVRDLLD